MKWKWDTMYVRRLIKLILNSTHQKRTKNYAKLHFKPRCFQFFPHFLDQKKNLQLKQNRIVGPSLLGFVWKQKGRSTKLWLLLSFQSRQGGWKLGTLICKSLCNSKQPSVYDQNWHLVCFNCLFLSRCQFHKKVWISSMVKRIANSKFYANNHTFHVG